MFTCFKSQQRKDFDRAQDYLESSRILMNSALETSRSIEESNVERYEQLLELIAAVTLNAQFLNVHLESAFRQFGAWEQSLNDAPPERYARVRRLLINTRKNFAAAREHTEMINLWMENDMVLLALFS
jgi:hypothetical protein